jgi:hypothetical protein
VLKVSLYDEQSDRSRPRSGSLVRPIGVRSAVPGVLASNSNVQWPREGREVTTRKEPSGASTGSEGESS